jgi:hypothetical protein
MKTKTYEVNLYNGYRHGQYKSNYIGIGSWTVTATSKAAAKQFVLDNLIGLKAKDLHFPIDAAHAPEYHEVKDSDGRIYYTAKQIELDEHIINEYDIQLKNQIVADVTEIKD